MRSLLLILLLAAVAQAQSSSTNAPPPSSSSPSGSSSANRKPNLAPPRSDSVSAADLGDDTGDSSSKEDPVDLSPPAGDVKAHKDSDILTDEGSGSEFHPWDPHKASKDVEVGDFYFKKKNYTAAESRYREALYYKENDAIATYRLAVCLEKLDRPDDALSEYESYLKILPNGPEGPDAKKAIERLSTHAAGATSPK
jgi:tetratricopeptide (TPR) repeat protein